MRWRKRKQIYHHPDKSDEDRQEEDAMYLVQENWHPVGETWPIWNIGLMPGCHSKNYQKNHGYKIILFRQDGPTHGRSGQEVLSMPAFVLRRLAAMIQGKVG